MKIGNADSAQILKSINADQRQAKKIISCRPSGTGDFDFIKMVFLQFHNNIHFQILITFHYKSYLNNHHSLF